MLLPFSIFSFSNFNLIMVYIYGKLLLISVFNIWGILVALTQFSSCGCRFLSLEHNLQSVSIQSQNILKPSIFLFLFSFYVDKTWQVEVLSHLCEKPLYNMFWTQNHFAMPTDWTFTEWQYNNKLQKTRSPVMHVLKVNTKFNFQRYN